MPHDSVHIRDDTIISAALGRELDLMVLFILKSCSILNNLSQIVVQKIGSCVTVCENLMDTPQKDFLKFLLFLHKGFSCVWTKLIFPK